MMSSSVPASAAAVLLRRVSRFMKLAVETGSKAHGTLVSASYELIEDLRDATMLLCDKVFCGQVPDILQQLQQNHPKFWTDAFTLHFWAVRDFATLQRSLDRTQLKKSLHLVYVTPRLLYATNALLPPSKQSRQLITTILRSDMLACYATILSALKCVPPAELIDSLGLLSMLLLAPLHVTITVSGSTSQDCRLLTGVNPPSSTANPFLYWEWITALASTAFLDHCARAYLQLGASAKAAIDAGACNDQHALEKAVEITSRLTALVCSIVKPLTQQPILALCPRPLSPFNANANPTLLASLPTLRKVLSGTCLQFWLGKGLLESRLVLEPGGANMFGLPEAALLPLQLRPSMGSLQQHLMNVCTTVWQVTVSGPLPPTPQHALGRSLPPVSREPVSLPASMPYNAINVYDMVFDTLSCVTDLVPTWDANGRADFNVVNALSLLTRLVAELESQHATARLPGLWHVTSKLTPMLCLRNQQLAQEFLRMILTLLQTVLPSESGPGESPAAAVGGADQRPCSISLRCALDSHFLPSLEHAIRRIGCWPSPNNLAAAVRCFNATLDVLRVSGMWPAMVAHGVEKEVMSLIATLSKFARVVHDAYSRLLIVFSPSDVGYDSVEAAVCLLALLEQLAAVVLQPLSFSAKSGHGGGGGGGSHLARGAAGAGSTTWPSKAELLQLNSALETEPPNDLTVEWLSYVGGQPPLGSSAAAQQRLIMTLALTQWLPLVMQNAYGSLASCGFLEMQRAVSRAVLLVALQAMHAVEDVSDALRAVRPGEGRSVPLEQVQRLESWRGLLRRMDVMSWVRLLLAYSETTRQDCPELMPTVLNVLELLMLTLHPVDFMDSLSLVPNGDGTSSASSRSRRRAGKGKPKDRAGRSDSRTADSGSAGAGSASIDSVVRRAAEAAMQDIARSPVRLEEATLLRYGRRSLLSAIRDVKQALMTTAEATLRPGGGSIYGVDRTGNVSIPKPVSLEALRVELLAAHDLTQIPVLPPPIDAERAAAAAGVKRCGSAECSSLKGPQECALNWKRCSRCRAVTYCSVACQRAHWTAGHNKDCVSCPD